MRQVVGQLFCVVCRYGRSALRPLFGVAVSRGTTARCSPRRAIISQQDSAVAVVMVGENRLGQRRSAITVRSAVGALSLR